MCVLVSRSTLPKWSRMTRPAPRARSVAYWRSCWRDIGGKLGVGGVRCKRGRRTNVDSGFVKAEDSRLGYGMKRRDLERHLRAQGCRLSRHGSRHDIWVNALTLADAA